ncbi:MAG: nuclear transport factor 2 family protein [Acidimicrobiia bacterium]
MSERLDQWMDGYVLAWSSNDPEHIAALFTPEAVYDPQTADGEWHGSEEIVRRWQEIGDEEDNWEFEWLPLVETDDLAIVVGRTQYHDPPMRYRNLFVIYFAEDGRCRDFTEWYIEEESG